MSLASVLLPLFVQVALTFVLLLWTGNTRVGALKRKEVKVSDIALGQGNWPDRVMKIGNNYNNQLQLPVLFYVLVILAWITRKADLLFVVLSWVFVISRIVHAWVHTTTNEMQVRFYAFASGAAVLLIMWAIFALRILLSS
ncbi:MAG: MAPEG family protein [Xanthobacteraceae bacterium]|nr:MAPEG family protein [Xanthobacteraceae bacterium]